MDLRARGGIHFAAERFDEALHCYSRALDTGGCPDVGRVLISASTTSLVLGDAASALCFSFAAHRLSPGNLTAIRCLVEALEAFDRSDIALYHLTFDPGYLASSSNSLDGWFRDTRSRLNEACIKARREKIETQSALVSNMVRIFANKDLLTRNLSRSGSLAPRASSESILDLKTSRDTLFSAGLFQGALDSFKEALAGEDARVASILLSNIAECDIRQGKYEHATLQASAAIVINPSYVKGHFRRISALMKLHSACDKIRQAALDDAPSDRSIHYLRDHFSRLKRERRQNSPADARSLELSSRVCDNPISTERLSEVDMLRRLQSICALVTSYLDIRIAPFHDAFRCNGRLPPGIVNFSPFYNKLVSSFVLTRCLLHHIDLFQLEDINISRQIRLQRAAFDTDTFDWLDQASLGSVRFRTRHPSPQTNIHSFQNQPKTKLKVFPGETHVSVGFVDLGELLISELYRPGTEVDMPFRWVGYESSPYSVAKTLVIVQMMLSGVGASEVLQVWFSAGWSLQTLRAFHSALALVEARDDQDVCVRNVLAAWMNTPVLSLFWARQKWSLFHPGVHTEIGSFRHERDRNALCSYLVSGDFCVDTPEVSSVTMCGELGEAVGVLSLDESILECFDTEFLVACARSHADTDVMNALGASLLKKVEQLTNDVLMRRIVIEVCHDSVSPVHSDVYRTISDLNAASISWSNICDYHDPAEFHEMALACSSPSLRTIHHMAPMNWPVDVCGSFLMDHRSMFDRCQILETAMKEAKEEYKSSGTDQILHYPPIGNAMNLCDSHLCDVFAHIWVKTFLAASESPICHISQARPLCSQLLRFNSTIHLSFLYE